MSVISITLLTIYLLVFVGGMLYPIVAGDVQAAKEYGDVFCVAFFWPALVFIAIPLVFTLDRLEKFHPIIAASQFMNKFWQNRASKKNG